MHIAVLTMGSRGDTQPYLALAVGLQRAGHRVTLTAPTIFRELIESYGIPFAPMSVNPQDLIKDPEIQAKLKSGNVVTSMLAMKKLADPLWQTSFAEMLNAAAGADAVLGSITVPGYFEVADKLGVPAITAHLVPSSPTREMPNFILPIDRSLGGALNKLSVTAFDAFFWAGLAGPINTFRKRIGLPKVGNQFARMRRESLPILCAYSPSLLPRPADWGANHHMTGYWFLDAPDEFTPPADLVAFLEEGDAPVYIGFGSMTDEDPERTTRMALDALKLAGARGVLYSGWAGLGGSDLPDSVYLTGSIPHDWLFPRMAAVVTHGGAGTTAAVLRAGVPPIVNPFNADQFGWARVVAEKGIGPKAAPIKTLTAEILSGAIREALTNTSMRDRATEIGARIRGEDGVGKAVRVIERIVG